MFLQLFKKKKYNKQAKELRDETIPKTKVSNKDINDQIAVRKGEIGEYKIDIQLDQFPKEYKHLSDIMVRNQKSSSGFSQIDHILISPFGIFVIETKNYKGTIYGGKNRKEWSVNGKFKMMNPFTQNYGHIKVLKSMIDSKYHDNFISIVSFTKRCTFKVDLEMRKITSNELIVYDVELSEFINRKINVLKLQNKNSVISDEEIESIYNMLSDANITETELIEKHKSIIVKKKEENDAKKNNQGTHKCVMCNKPVSEKVAAFCLSNKKFAGNIYCYQHQKKI
ncbi:NERD nuclease [Oceanobacillus arenosus]|uniref:NERD nuclease n=1 Tax=Oceanobacillus arenosus TaxID=1229153 RepID=A0A3D8PNE5_9BACI|nr:nuclease-related domain-containing protein [Oceanobacillus arenosus]RDW17494.1 NERD nuclease [Oceanobacillus arenosus]